MTENVQLWNAEMDFYVNKFPVNSSIVGVYEAWQNKCLPDNHQDSRKLLAIQVLPPDTCVGISFIRNHFMNLLVYNEHNKVMH